MSFVGNWDEFVCFVGKKATKVLERLEDWAGTTWGGWIFTTYKSNWGF